MNKDMIEQLKNNLAEFQYSGTDTQAEFERVGVEDCEVLLANGSWCAMTKGKAFHSKQRHRLRADYEPEKPEPEVVECEVYIEKDTDGLDTLFFTDSLDDRVYAHAAVDWPNFIGYKYKSGTIYHSPRMNSGDCKAAAYIPTHVLFAKGI